MAGEDIEQASPSGGAREQTSSVTYKRCCSMKTVLALIAFGLACFGVGFGLGWLTYDRTRAGTTIEEEAGTTDVQTVQDERPIHPGKKLSLETKAAMEACLEGSLSLLDADDEFLRNSLHTVFNYAEVDCGYYDSVDPTEFADTALPCSIRMGTPTRARFLEERDVLPCATCEDMEGQDLEMSWHIAQFQEDCEASSGELWGIAVGEVKDDRVICTGYVMPIMGAELDYLWLCLDPRMCTDLTDEQLKDVSLDYLNKELATFDNEYAVCCRREDITEKVRLVSKCRKDFQVNRGAICEASEDRCAFAIDLSQSDAQNCGQYCESMNAACLYGGGYDEDCTKKDKFGCDETFTDDRCVCAWE